MTSVQTRLLIRYRMSVTIKTKKHLYHYVWFVDIIARFYQNVISYFRF